MILNYEVQGTPNFIIYMEQKLYSGVPADGGRGLTLPTISKTYIIISFIKYS